MTKIDTSKTTIDNLLNRGVADCEIKKHLKARLEKGETIHVKLGIDPTGSELHVGHAVVLRKLRDFQKAGHRITLIIGTFTGKIGDPTGKDKTRPPLTDEMINENMKDFLEQASVVLDINKIEIKKNGEWLSNMTFKDVVELASSFTVQQMTKRDSFFKRIQAGHEISLHEFLYPLMQGYDSVALKSDLELGGTDQLFNLMAGRQIQRRFEQKPQDIMTVPILVGTDGKEKMSKSLGNYIGLKETPKEMFGKTMSIPDDLMENWFEVLTSIPLTEIQTILKGHPRDAKLTLAREIVSEFHDSKKAEQSQKEFLRMFADKGLPDDLEEIIMEISEHKILDVMVISKLCASGGEIKRMIKQGGVKFDDQKIISQDEIVQIRKKGKILQVGKRKFIELA